MLKRSLKVKTYRKGDNIRLYLFIQNMLYINYLFLPKPRHECIFLRISKVALFFLFLKK